MGFYNVFYWLLLVSSISIAQTKNKICYQIEYIQTIDFGKPTPRTYSLFFNNEFSIYEEQGIGLQTQKIEKKESEFGSEYMITETRKNMKPESYLNLGTNFFFRKILFDNELIVKDSIGAINWKILNEFQDINGIKCQKAITTFRGRSYTAWFSEEIPTKFGPWKFKDLPGLIIEIGDDEDHLHIIARKIKKLDYDDCNKISVDIPISSYITMDEFLVQKREILNEELNRISSRLPKGFGKLKISSDCKDCSQEIEIF